jgi:hypothetical protein
MRRLALILVPGIAVLLACCVPLTADQGRAAEKTAKSWAWQTPVRPDVPGVKDRCWVRNPIDAFILSKLEANHFGPVAEADRVTLIRRVTLDLTGLPPTPEEVDAFANDSSPDAYERLVDRLLASPAYGERWATFWLDLARYAETDGFKADDPRPDAWRYRDYVIHSLNNDKPYDRFLTEQIAGDERYPDNPNAWIATGFLRHYPDEYNAVNLEQRRQEILNDITDTTAQVFLGITIGCARCHDHKFDPITQEDYYRIQAFFGGFWPTERPIADSPERQRKQREWEEKTAELRQRMAQLEEPYRQQFHDKRKVRFQKEYQDLLEIPAERRSPLERQLAVMVEKQVGATNDEVSKSMKPEIQKEWKDLATELASFASLKPPAPPTAMSMTDVGPEAAPTYLLRKGDWRRKGHEAKPGYPSAIDGRDADVPKPANGAKSSGRRSALAAWLVRPDNPLTARVMVNRLWQHHFGRGIVATPGDFGAQGDPPTHPELLDWLADEFRAKDWSIKALHRLMVTSATYRQTSRPTPEALRTDPDNKLFCRMNRRRLEGEAIRDAMLAVCGELNPAAGGPSIFPELPLELGNLGGRWKVSPAPERDRRSIYVYAKRNLRYPLFAAHDAPDGNETCSRRDVTTTAPQALILLNSKVTLHQAQAFAGRVLRETDAKPQTVVERAYRLALGRAPDAEESKLTLAFLEKQAEALRPRLKEKNLLLSPLGAPDGVDPSFGAAVVDLCHALMNMNEFIYVD